MLRDLVSIFKIILCITCPRFMNTPIQQMNRHACPNIESYWRRWPRCYICVPHYLEQNSNAMYTNVNAYKFYTFPQTPAQTLNIYDGEFMMPFAESTQISRYVYHSLEPTYEYSSCQQNFNNAYVHIDYQHNMSVIDRSIYFTIKYEPYAECRVCARRFK